MTPSGGIISGVDMPTILANIEPQPDGCVLWTRAVGSHGYGVARYHGRPQLVHRLVYAHLVGAIPDGKHLDHTCSNRRCVNPEHLQPVTIPENNAASRRRGRHGNQNTAKAACPRCGGAFTIYTGERRCRPCRAAYLRAWRAARGAPD